MNQINPAASDIVAKLWNLCNLLRDDGVTRSEEQTGERWRQKSR
jgi:hypothetical protein